MRSVEDNVAEDSIPTASDGDGDRPKKTAWYQTWGPPLVIVGGTAVMGVIGWALVTYAGIYSELIRKEFDGVENKFEVLEDKIATTDERMIREFNALNSKLDSFRETSEGRIERLEDLHLTAKPDESSALAVVVDETESMTDALGGYGREGNAPAVSDAPLDTSKPLAYHPAHPSPVRR
ncbi:MAG: hypothetical protein F4010_01775 [Cenarchaeum sp. SB0669_bin_11]|nr:hypothetical protein [Cenarchaeum sp. SB0669_bin_11]